MSEDGNTIRDRQRKIKRRQMRDEREVKIPTLSAQDLAKRLALEADDAEWLRFFFADVFTFDFTWQQAEMIRAIGSAIEHGGDQAIAASRGEGKSSCFETLITKYVLQGKVGFALLCAATGSKADDSLKAIKDALEDSGDFQGSVASERLGKFYPEVCVPVRALEGAPQRAHGMVVSGWRRDRRSRYEFHPCKFTWCGNQITLPNVPGSPSAGAIIATAGLEKEVRGMKKGRRRPEVIGIDDPDTEETVNSEDQARKLENRIERGLARLGGQRRRVARVMLTTLQRRSCVSAKFTDPTQKPAWKGRRFRFLLKPPDRMDMWDEYIAMVAADQQAVDEHGVHIDPYARRAHKFYLDHRTEMDAGAEVANCNRFYGDELPDGSQQEVSALQHYFNAVVAMGSKEAVATEYDNDPPEEESPQESGITPHRIQCQVNGLDRKVVPAGTVKITQGIDCRKTALHWVVRAWAVEEGAAFATGHTIDYGVTEVRGTTQGSDEGLDEAIYRALRERRDQLETAPYTTEAGAVVPVDLTLIDSAWQQGAVYQFCREDAIHFKPAIGAGEGGATQANFHPVIRNTFDKLAGDAWFQSRQSDRGLWLVVMDSRDWKQWEHNRWMSDPKQPGALLMWGLPPDQDDIRRGRLSRDQKAHFSYSKHITAEVLIEQPGKDGILTRRWKAKSDTNHYLDASYRADVAASMLGVPLLGRRVSATARPQIQMVSLSEMAGK